MTLGDLKWFLNGFTPEELACRIVSEEDAETDVAAVTTNPKARIAYFRFTAAE